MVSSSRTFDATVDEGRWFAQRSRSPRLRTMREFAEQEIVLPDGPYEGFKFRCDRQPYSRLWFDAVSSNLFPRKVATGPSQSGKTLHCCVIPLLYHLFEIGETCIFGLPDMGMASDKWRQDLKPVIERSRYRDLLPKLGSGSKGGKVSDIQFGHGPTLKFMSGGGGDKSRAGFTARVLMLTEIDGMDESGGNSREADKITQMEARTLAYGDRKCIYAECTVSVEKGRTWREYKAGTESKLVLNCPHCKAWVYPERSNLVGWESGQSDMEAGKLSSYFCPSCAEAWSEDDRHKANGNAKLVHRGQDIDEAGKVVGDIPTTDTLGFRWSAVNNMFTSANFVGKQEWKASRATDEVNAEKELRQFYWALPHLPTASESTPLEHHQLVTRMLSGHRQGIVPAWAKFLTLGADLGKYLCHWTLVAWGDTATGHVVDYGRLDVPTDDFGEEIALKKVLQELREHVNDGWFKHDGSCCVPDRVWIDAGWHGEVVYGFVRESGQRFLPILGRSSIKAKRYFAGQKKSTGSVVAQQGEEYALATVPEEMCYRAEINADYWKSWLHKRLACPLESKDSGGMTVETRGRLTLFEDDPRKHTSFAKHLTAEVEIESFEPGKGTIKAWTPIRDANHWLDSTYIACAAGHHCGVRLIQDELPLVEKRKVVVNAGLSRPDGRNWI